MIIAISKACSYISDAEKGKIETRPVISFVPESTVDAERTDKNKDELILVTCRYRPRAEGSKKNNYVIQAKHFETGTTEDVLRWYITLQRILGKSPSEDAEAKFGMLELLLGGKCKRDFMQISLLFIPLNNLP